MSIEAASERKEWLPRIGEMERIMAEGGNGETAEKIRRIAEKWNRGKWVLAFCGHFSAGKSTLINRLCGAALLPSSPIPTSANLVSIQNGSEGASITSRKDGTKQTVPIHRLAEFCKNGEDIEAVEIYYPVPFLGEHAMLLDTPGIDSTDEAHMRATESALYLADAVFYVMDYNHVQSEINFAFTKRLQSSGKPLYLIVNQIDKHEEKELSFTAYREGVRQAFSHWNIRYHGLFFVSLKDPRVPGNEWDKLRWTIGELAAHAPGLRQWTAVRSVAQVAEEYAQWLRSARNEEKETLRSLIREVSPQGDPVQEWEEIQRRIEEEKSKPDLTADSLKKEIFGLLENANLTPASLRDLAHRYLESRQPGFKKGFWFASRHKTEEERNNRLRDFHSSFQEQVRAQLEWHLQKLCQTYRERAGLEDEIQANELTVDVSEQWLADQVSPGAVLSGEYTLNYCHFISAEMKARYRKRALEWLELFHKALRERSEKEIAAHSQRLERLAQAVEAKKKLEEMEEEEEKQLAALNALLPKEEAFSAPLLPDPSHYVPQSMGTEHIPGMAAKAAAAAMAETAAVAAKESAVPAEAVTEYGNPGRGADGGAIDKNEDPFAQGSAPLSADSNIAANMRKQLDDAAGILQRAGSILRETGAMESLAEALLEKAERLSENRFTIALFGAFSAGKSSFANALMGESVLPVSPHPTTAAINRILPPDRQWPHGRAKVVLKSEEQLFADVRYSMEFLGFPVNSMEEALKRIETLQGERIPEKGKPHVSFLRAVAEGYGAVRDKLGTTLQASLSEFHDYVAVESRSCFVDHIELFYSSPLTDQGIVLVDTPGADSINARHTGVAFNYIKNADAVLYVTYYNHAFSQADREFLRQLGRVKDSFEMDKMFFVVNAADLASSGEELDAVLGHVESNLRQYGVRQPRLYPVSSKWAMAGKKAGDRQLTERSGIVPFERDFFRFVFEELGQLALSAARRDLQRAAATLKGWLESSRKDRHQREQESAALKQSLARLLSVMKDEAEHADVQPLEKEIDELLYYVHQRVTFRFGELYNLAFHPSVLHEDGGDLRRALRLAFNELAGAVSSVLSQEVLATTLRVERFLQIEGQKRRESWGAAASLQIPDYSVSPLEFPAFSTPVVKETMEGAAVEDKWLLERFKNAKSFFEGDGKKRLQDELEQKFQPLIRNYLEEHASMLKSHYREQYAAFLNDMLDKTERDLREHVQGLLQALELKIDLAEIQRKCEQLEQLCARLGVGCE